MMNYNTSQFAHSETFSARQIEHITTRISEAVCEEMVRQVKMNNHGAGK
jgi:hypothetical protein